MHLWSGDRWQPSQDRPCYQAWCWQGGDYHHHQYFYFFIIIATTNTIINSIIIIQRSALYTASRIPPDQKSVRELNYVSHHCQASSVATKTSIWQKNFPRRYLWEDALKYLGNDPLGPGELSRGGVQGCGQQMDKRHRSQHYSWLHWRQVIDPQSLGKDWDMRGGFLPSDFCSTATALETSPPSRRTGAGLCTDWWGDLRSTRPVGIFVGCWPLLFVLLIGWPRAQCHQSCKQEHNMVVNKTLVLSLFLHQLLRYHVLYNTFS